MVTANESARVGLALNGVDECLLEALRQTLHSNEGLDGIHSMTSNYLEAQHYFTQLTALRLRLGNLCTGLNYQCFSKTLPWYVHS